MIDEMLATLPPAQRLLLEKIRPPFPGPEADARLVPILEAMKAAAAPAQIVEEEQTQPTARVVRADGTVQILDAPTEEQLAAADEVDRLNAMLAAQS